MPSLPLKERIMIMAGSLLLTLVIYTVIDLYVPAKQWLSGNQMSFSELMTHIQIQKKAPFIALISVLMARTTIKKRTKALAEKQQETPQPLAQ